MQIKDFDCLVATHGDLARLYSACIVAAGPLTKQPGSTPFRVVLIAWRSSNEWSVHNQLLDNWPEPSLNDFADGDYFPPLEFHRAVAAFAERVSRDADSMRSLYRQQEVRVGQ